MAIATSLTVFDDAQVRVTTWTFATEGDDTGAHVHEYDYVVVPVTGGTFTIVHDDMTTTQLVQRAGDPYRGTAGTSHNVISSSQSPAVFVEIELKR
jgi:beta-alanine degradation protein BauB